MKSTKLCSINYYSKELAESAIVEFWNRETDSIHIDSMKRAKASLDALFDQYIFELEAAKEAKAE